MTHREAFVEELAYEIAVPLPFGDKLCKRVFSTGVSLIADVIETGCEIAYGETLEIINRKVTPNPIPIPNPNPNPIPNPDHKRPSRPSTARCHAHPALATGQHG